MKPFTTIAGILFLLGAAVHGYRLYSGFSVVVAGHSIPMNASWAFVAIGVVLGLGLLSEARR
jgi:hypothetical protein